MYRIVHNAQTDTYRVEKKGLFGWDFVLAEDNGDYLQFGDLAAARRWVGQVRARDNNPSRRWRVVAECDA